LKLLTEEPRRQLKSIVAALNGKDVRLKDEEHAQLVRFVTAWNRAKRNPWKMRLPAEDAKRFSFPNLEKVWRLHLSPIGRTPETERLVRDLERAGKHVRDDVGGVYWSISPTGKNFCTGIVQNTDRKAGLREKKHKEDLKRARNAAQKWETSTRVEWKKFVSDETGLTFKWLTRAVNQGALRQPRTQPHRSQTH